MGPNSRALLQKLTSADLSNAAFPVRRVARDRDRLCRALRASRITYVGELGWELYVPGGVRRRRLRPHLAEGAAFGLKLAGMHAMNCLRIEKAYRHWGHDIGDDDTPLEAGLGFCRRLWTRRCPSSAARRCSQQKSQAQADASAWCSSRSRTRSRCSITTSRSTATASSSATLSSAHYGHTLGRAIALGYVNAPEGVDQAYLDAGKFELEVACRRYPARASLRPLYDPKSERMRV